MIRYQTASLHIEEPTTILTFFIEVGPLLLASLSFSGFIFFLWYFAVELNGQRKKQQLWFAKNEKLIKRYKDLYNLLEVFGQYVPSCGNCDNDKMQLWDAQQDLLVLRCRCCKMNYTYTKAYYKLIQPIISQIEETKPLVNTLVKYRNHALGKHLANELAILPNSINSDLSTLGIIHFTASKDRMTTAESVLDTIIDDWEVLHPDRLELLAS